MNPVYLDYIKIILLFWAVALLHEHLRYTKLLWTMIYDLHVVVVLKEKPEKYGGGKLHEKF